MDQMMASENAEIVFQLLVEDLNAISLGSKGKNKVGDVPDAEMAVQLFQDELRQSLSSLADHRMAQSIADAVQLDGPVLFGAFTCEDQVVRDHTIARHLSGQRTDMELDGAIRNEVDISDELLATMAALYATKPEYLTNYDFAGESSTVHDRRQKDSRSCIACFADKKFFEVAQAPCQHNYCQDCVRDLFTTALSDESLFPPRCCGQTIPLETVRIFVTSELAATFKNKTVEFETSNRTYCCIQTCSGFIPAEFIQNDIAKCQECGTTTCRICKHEAHTSDCIGDEALQQVLEVATANGWQRCHSCKQMIELDVGCNHITCRCGAQFCYLCGERWKTCPCEQWNEDRLMMRANQIAGREYGNRRQNADLRNFDIYDIARNLRERHQCNHQVWRRLPGGHRCEECSFILQQYIFECRQCQLQVCNRCRRNRL